MLLATVASLLLTAQPADLTLVVPAIQPPNNWLFVVVTAPDFDADWIVPTLRFEHTPTGQVIEKHLNGVRPGRPSFRLVQGPELRGLWTVSMTIKHQGALLGRAAPTSLRVTSLPLFAVGIVLLLAALIAAGYALRGARRRVRLAIAAVALGTAWLWLPLLLAGHTLFGLLAVALIEIARRHAGRPIAFLHRASIALALFSELYWGAMVNGTFWTAPVISLTALWICWRLLALLFRRPRGLAIATFIGAAALTLTDVSMNIYKAFFLDYPSVSAGGEAGQVGRLLDSVGYVFRTTHILALLAPFAILAITFWLRHQPRPTAPHSAG